MRILVLSFHYSPDLTAGAFRVAAFVKALARRLPADAEIHVVTSDRLRRRVEGHSGEHSPPAERCRILVHRAGRLIPGRIGAVLPVAVLRFALRAFRIARTHPPDLVIGSSSKLATAILAAAVARRSGVRLHLDFRDLFTDHLRSLLPGIIGRGLRGLFLPCKRWVIRQAGSVSATNAVQARYLRVCFSAPRCAVVSNGIEPSFREHAFDAPNSNRETLRVLYVGNLGRAQGLHRILPQLAAETATTAQWRVIGNGAMRNRLKRITASPRWWRPTDELPAGNLEILQPVARERLAEHYRWADVLFLHLAAGKSTRRVVPSKVFEYAATGKAILAGVSGAARRLIEQEIDGGYCFAPEDVADALQQLGKIDRARFDRSEFCARYDRQRLAEVFVDVVLNSH